MLLKKLVIAEDDDSIAHLVAASLGDAGFLCLRAWDGEEALDLVRTELPDLLVLDLMMPKVDGMEVCKRIKSDVILSRVPILMLTSLAGVENRVEGLEAGADDYLSKPFDLRELAARVKALIRQNRRERERNPTTNLPGTEAIEDRVSDLLKAGEHFTLLYIDIENFRAYADVYGYRKADDVIAQVGQLLLGCCRDVADAPPFLGHLGGDDFIIICSSADVCETLRIEFVSAFEEISQRFYNDDDRQQGYITVRDAAGDLRQAQLMTASIALLDVPPGKYKSTAELAIEVTRVKSACRKRTESGLIQLGPRDPRPPTS